MDEDADDGAETATAGHLDDGVDAGVSEADSKPGRAITRPATKAGRTDTRRATVRYYSRMNPERVFPLLVLVTRQMVEKVRKEGTAQRASSPFPVDLAAPVEIEPVLPGCDCHPPRIVARLGTADLTAAFHVVPRVLGRVDGATVVIRQDHVVLARVGLEARVVQRGWARFAGVAAFLLPALSAGMKHFGLDFESQKDQGFSLYLAAARLVFDRVSPLALTAGLGAAAGVLWWFTRPVARDVFFDVGTTGPAKELRRIAAGMRADPSGAADDLMELLRAYPDFRPARLFYAEWHSKLGNYAAALKGYDRAFVLGAAKDRHYLQASLAASRLGRHERALRILQEAVRLLPPGGLTGLMQYNMGCYHACLGEADEAMACLVRAVRAGYRKVAAYKGDPDLDPLRSRSDFRRLLADVEAG